MNKEFMKTITVKLLHTTIEVIVSVLLISAVLTAFMATGLYESWVKWVTQLV